MTSNKAAHSSEFVIYKLSCEEFLFDFVIFQMTLMVSRESIYAEYEVLSTLASTTCFLDAPAKECRNKRHTNPIKLIPYEQRVARVNQTWNNFIIHLSKPSLCSAFTSGLVSTSIAVGC